MIVLVVILHSIGGGGLGRGESVLLLEWLMLKWTVVLLIIIIFIEKVFEYFVITGIVLLVQVVFTLLYQLLSRGECLLVMKALIHGALRDRQATLGRIIILLIVHIVTHIVI